MGFIKFCMWIYYLDSRVTKERMSSARHICVNGSHVKPSKTSKIASWISEACRDIKTLSGGFTTASCFFKIVSWRIITIFLASSLNFPQEEEITYPPPFDFNTQAVNCLQEMSLSPPLARSLYEDRYI